jgi:glycosyltransferase involved in cell wall biosynthesis
MISIIIPIYNEFDNIVPLFEKLMAELPVINSEYEVILVNDGSTDKSYNKLCEIASKNLNFKVVNLRRNFGQTAAIMAGIDFASGDVIVPMDGDLQNDPSDVKRLLEKLNEGYDVVSGWRKERQDAAIRRNFVSKIANKIISKISGVSLHDYGCSLKAYRKDVLKDVKLYGEMHRFIPIYASWFGAKVTEIPVKHYPRIYGQSKYGLERIGKVILDLLVVKYFSKYLSKPIYVFGGFGFFSLLISLLSLCYALTLKIIENISFIQTPLPLLSVMTFVTGIMSILMGFLAEMIVRTYYESQGKDTYLVKNTINLENK